jgi:hypothetical protein
LSAYAYQPSVPLLPAALLDRGFGKATLPISGDTEGPPVSITFRWADAVTEQQPEPELDDAVAEAGTAGFTFAGECIC